LEESKDQTILVVVSGKVAFSPREKSGEKVLLTQEQQAILNHESNEIREGRDFDHNDLAWKTKKLVFDDHSLEYVLEYLSDHFQVHFEESPTKNGSCNFSGEFDNLSLQEALNILNYSLGVEFEQKETHIAVSTPDC
jgi:ferric-dicitrate binding protein FerR (iron transport regulator)